MQRHLARFITLALFLSTAASGAQEEIIRGKPLSTYIKNLSDPDARVRRMAVFALAEAKKPTEEAVQGLVKTLSLPDAGVHHEALSALGRYGPLAKSAAPALIEIIRDKKSTKRSSALLTLGKLEIKSKEVLQLLMDAASEGNDDIRNSAFAAMRSFGPDMKPALPMILEALKDTKKRAIYGALTALGGMGPAGKEYLPMLEPLLYKDLFERTTSLAMADIGGKDALPYLLKAIQDPRVRFRYEFLEPIRKLDPDGKASLPVLAPLIREKDTVGHNVGFTLSSFGTAAIPHVLPMLGDEKAETRRRAAGVLGAIGRKDASVLPLLQKALEDKSPLTREGAARALAGMASAIKPALPALTAALKDDPQVAQQAAIALARAGVSDKAVVQTLAGAIAQKDRQEAKAAIDALGSLKEGAREALPALIEQLKVNDGYLNAQVMHVLELMGPAAKEAVPAILDTMAQDRYAAPMYPLHLVAEDTLRAIGPDAIPHLVKALEADNPRLCDRAMGALRQFGKQAKAATPVLLRLLKSDDKNIARAAGLTLKRTDPEAAKMAGVK